MSDRDDAMKSVLDADRAIILACAARVSDAARVALAETVAEPSVARATGRVLGIDKSLAWKLVSLAQAPDPGEAISMFPGPRGWRQIIEALSRNGVSRKSLDELRQALTELERESERRGFDRRRLRSLASDSDSSDRGRHETWRLRESASVANSAIWGMSAGTLVASYLLHPAEDANDLAISAMTMFLGLHRSRPGPEMAIHRRSRIRSTDGEEAASGDDGFVIDCDDLCSPGAVEQISTRVDLSGPYVAFRGDRTSPANPADLVFGERIPSKAYVFAREPDEQASFGLPIWVPVQSLVLEVLLHRDIPWAGSPTPVGLSELVSSTHQLPWRALHEFPIAEAVEPAFPLEAEGTLAPPSLGSGVSPSATTAYTAAITRAAEAIGGRPEDFVRHRLVVPHPLLSSNVVLRWTMPTRDGSP